jgi:hypothetical protein
MNKPMQIANPIYDVVFKYLMEDNKIAKLIISKIIESQVMKLDFLAKEHTLEINQSSLTVYRLDFIAKIKTSDQSHKIVLIEIQKAKFPTDIMRFRRYLGEQYADSENIYLDSKSGQSVKKALPIISIYFLGHQLSNIDSSLIKIKRNYYDSITGEEIKQRDDFIESLTHDSYIIQIPCLKERRRNDLEVLLSIFDQNLSSPSNRILNINEADFPSAYQPIIRRLQKAIAEPKVRDTMDIEDEILQELENKERLIENQQEEIKEKAKKLEEKEKKLEEKDMKLEEKEKAIAEQENELKTKNKLIEELQNQLKNIKPSK